MATIVIEQGRERLCRVGCSCRLSWYKRGRKKKVMWQQGVGKQREGMG